MKKISLFFIERPILVNFIILVNFLIGGYFIYKVPKEAFPGVSLNQIVIVTKYPGASARDVELNVTAKIEEKLLEVGSIKEFRSSSIESVSRITVSADNDLNDVQFRELLSDVQTDIDKIDDFPADLDGQPIITSVTTKDKPIIEIAFTGPYNTLINSLPKIESQIRKIKGVSTVTSVGIPDQEIHIEVDAKKALDKEIDLNSVYMAINTRNQVGTGGTLESIPEQKKVVSFNKYEKAQDVLNTILRMSPDGNGVYLKDIATIEMKPKDNKLVVRNNGKNGATILVAIRSGMDQLKVSDRIKSYLKKIKLPHNINFKINNDVSDKARSKFSLLKTNGLIGFILVSLLLFFFLGKKIAFWTAFGIPFTIFGSMILFVPLGMTLNSVSMGSFVIILGMIVDDAMVIGERFDTNLEEGMSPNEAASSAVERLWKPVFAASLTTIIAFSPLLSLGGLPGKFIWQMPVVVIIALFVSLIDCYLLLPAHLAHGSKQHIKRKKMKLVSLMEDYYTKILSKFLDLRYALITIFLIILFGSLYIGMNKLKKDSFPQESSEGFTIKLTLHKGIQPKEVTDAVLIIEKEINKLPENELEGYTSRLGTHSISSLTDYGTEENLVSFIVYLTPYDQRERTAQNIIDNIKSNVQGKFKQKIKSLTLELMRIGPPLGEPFEIIILSNNDKKRKEAEQDAVNYLKTITGLFDIKNDYIAGKDEINLKLDYKKVAQAGLTPADIVRTLRISFDGLLVTDYTSAKKSYDYRLRLTKETRGDFNFISKLPIANKRGQLIKLNTMIKYEEKPSFSEIYRFNGTRSTSITGGINSKRITPIDAIKLFENYFVNTDDVQYILTGRPVEEKEIFSGLKIAGLMAVIGIYFVLTLILNSYSKPLIILVTIPFGAVGIFLSFYFHGLAMSMFAGMGMIGLSGIVINDSIVLIDHITELFEKNGGFSKDILIRGAKERLRAILLTTISTVLAVIPTAYAIGGYDSLLSPLSLSILYGLLFSTTVVLLFIPCLFYVGVEFGKYTKMKTNSGVISAILVGLVSLGSLSSKHLQAQTIDISGLSHILESSSEHKIQDEFAIQSNADEEAIKSILDGKLTTKVFKVSSELYPTPPMTLDTKKESFGLSLDYQQMTSWGFQYELGFGIDDRNFKTIPQNPSTGLETMESYYKAALVIPLSRNFKSNEFYFNRNIVKKRSLDVKNKIKDEKEKTLSEAIIVYWDIAKLKAEKTNAYLSLKRFKELHALNKNKRRSGIISQSEFLTSEVELINRTSILTTISAQIDIELQKLSRILETDTYLTINDLKATLPFSNHFLKQRTKQEVKELILTGSTYLQIKTAEEVLQSKLNLENEQNKSNVDLFLSFKGYGRGDDATTSLTEDFGEKYEVMAGLNFNFDFGKHKSSGEIKKILSQKRQTILKKSQIMKRLIQIYLETNLTVESNLYKIKSLLNIKNRQEVILKVEKKRFKNGQITTLDFVKLQEAFDYSNLQIINLRYSNERIIATLYRLLGRLDIYLMECKH